MENIKLLPRLWPCIKCYKPCGRIYQARFKNHFWCGNYKLEFEVTKDKAEELQ